MPLPATPSDQKPAGDAPGEQHPALTFGDWLHQFWQKQGNLITAVITGIMLVILAKGGWEFYQARQEAGVEGDFAAATSPEKLKAFAAAHAGHALAGVAHLRLADDAYAAGRFADAQAEYQQAAANLPAKPFTARAQLGAAMAQLGAGKTADGEAALKLFAADATQLKGIRAEATYHLASLAALAGRGDEVVKYSDQLMQIDPTSPWTQRALELRASLPVAAVPPLPAAGKDAAPAAPAVQIKLPGK